MDFWVTFIKDILFNEMKKNPQKTSLKTESL